MTARRSLRLLIGSVCLLVGVWVHVRAQEPAAEPVRRAAPQPIGRIITVTPPITEQVEQRIRRVVNRTLEEARGAQGDVRPVVILRIEPGATEFGKAYDLANYLSSDALAGITTIAYVPQTLTGHAVLLPLACDQIVLHPDAELGNAGVDDPRISAATRSFYRELAARKRTVPEAVALGLLDNNLEVLEIETEVSREFVLAEDLPALKERRSIQAENILFRAGEPHLLTASQGRRLGFFSRLAPDVSGVASAAGLSRESLQEDPSLGDAWRAVRITIDGPLSAAKLQQTQRMIEEAISRENVNFILLYINSTGGSVVESITLANYLSRLDPGQQRTVAYIAGAADYDAAFIAVACDQIVMQDGSTLGGASPSGLPEQREIEAASVALREIAQRKFRSPTLVAALADPELAVARYDRPGDGMVEFLTPAEADNLDDFDQWRKTAQVTRAGEVLRVSAEEAVPLGIASQRVANFQELKALYSLENDPRLVEPGWVDILLAGLRSPTIAWFLLVLGGAALFAELQAPGIGVGAFVALVCFLLFFWAMYLGGTAGWLEVLLFTTGIICLLLEAFVLPGFGIFGLGGGLLVAASLVLASQTFIIPRSQTQFVELSKSMFMAASVFVGVLLAAALVRRILPHTAGGRAIFLDGGTAEEREELDRRETIVRWDHLLGRRGTVVTRLNPSGKVRFGDDFVDVISSGDLIPVDAEVEVIEARGNRVVVRGV